MKTMKHKAGFTMRVVLSILLVAIIIFPIYWMLLTSFRPVTESLSSPPNFFINLKTVTIKFYETVLSGKIGSSTNTYGFPTFFMNSVIISSITTLVTVFVSLLAAYSLVRFSNRFSNFLSHVLLVCYLIPTIGLLIPMFVMAVDLKLNNSLWGLIIFEIAGALPLGVWLAKAYIKGLPVELEEAATMDGCNRMQVITKIVLPISVPGLVVVGFNTFLGSWNSYALPNVLIDQERYKPMMSGLYLYFNQNIGIVWGEMMAASILSMLPVFFIFFYFQKYIVGGITAGAVKG